LPVNPNYFFLPAPVTFGQLKDILAGVESEAEEHPVDSTLPTNSWVTHLYRAVTSSQPPKQGYIVLYDIPPLDDAHPVVVAKVPGATEEEKAAKASALVGRGNNLIGYEDFAGPQRVVIYRETGTVPPPPSVTGELSWDTLAAREAWSTRLLGLVQQNLAQLETADVESFIAGYDRLAPQMKVKFWAELFVAMSKFESDWDPKNVFKEPPPLGVNSIGLLQLSLKDQEGYPVAPRIDDENKLKDPILNLDWAITIFARLLKRDGVVATSNGNAHRGAARYWSVLRAGHKIDLIKALTKKNVGLA
jgi:hypothetical protein